MRTKTTLTGIEMFHKELDRVRSITFDACSRRAAD